MHTIRERENIKSDFILASSSDIDVLTHPSLKYSCATEDSDISINVLNLLLPVFQSLVLQVPQQALQNSKNSPIFFI